MPDNKPQWTPGPWKVWAMHVCSAAPEHGGSQKQPNDSDVVANTYQRDEDGHQVICDACLIAAAPDMYTALERYLNLPADPSDMQISEADQQACAALLKANPQRTQEQKDDASR